MLITLNKFFDGYTPQFLQSFLPRNIEGDVEQFEEFAVGFVVGLKGKGSQGRGCAGLENCSVEEIGDGGAHVICY